MYNKIIGVQFFYLFLWSVSEQKKKLKERKEIETDTNKMRYKLE